LILQDVKTKNYFKNIFICERQAAIFSFRQVFFFAYGFVACLQNRG